MRTPKIIYLQHIRSLKFRQRHRFRPILPVEHDDNFVIIQNNRVDENIHQILAVRRVVDVAIFEATYPEDDFFFGEVGFLDFLLSQDFL